MNDDGTLYAFNPFAGYQQVPPLSEQSITFARAADHSHRAERAAQFRSQSPKHEAEYTLIYHLEVLWNAIKTLLRTYGRLGIGFRVDEDDLGYEDDLAWMGAKTEVGAAGEGVRLRISLGPGQGAGSSGSSPGATATGPESGAAILNRLRHGETSDPELHSRMKTIVRVYDTLLRGKKGGSNWITEKTVLRSSVYNVVLQGFAAYPLWHEDREFVDQLVNVVDEFVDHDR